MTNVVVFGVGGHGRECGGILRALEDRGDDLRLLGFVDDAPSALDLERVQRLDAPFLGRLEDGLTLVPDMALVLGIGSGYVRRQLTARVRALGIPSPVLIHPDASVGRDVEFAPGAVVFAGARITTNVRVGCHSHLNQNVTVGHDSEIGDFVSVNPSASISGNVRLEACVTVGAGAVVLQGLSVGSGATLGASACVVSDVESDAVVKGVPAR